MTPLHGLSSGTDSISLSSGGAQVLSIDLGTSHANQSYLVLGSASGWCPGLPLASGMLIPLNPDAYFDWTFAFPNTLMLDSLGTLDALGRAEARFLLPGGQDPLLAGLVLHHAAIAHVGSAAQAVTNAVALSLVP